MKKLFLPTLLLLAISHPASGRGLLIPVEPDLPPLAMLNHHVDVTIEDQVAMTRVAQTFRNHTDRPLEATYVFPVPPGASVRQLSLWVDGRRVVGELLKADKAREMYTRIVRQTQNPALLDYIGSDLLRLKIFPVPPRGDQKVEVRFAAVARKEHRLVEYVYPLKTDRQAASTLETFRLTVQLKSQQPIGSIYSPSHEITTQRPDDHTARVLCEEQGASLDRDFQLFYTHSGQDIGLTALQHRLESDQDGYAMLLVSPRAQLSETQKVPRDIVFVVDTSGSMMRGGKMQQAQAAVRQCLGALDPDDRFAVVRFATTVNRYRDTLVAADDTHVAQARAWVDDLSAGGGTAMHQALVAALDMQSDQPGRMFTVVFLTDGHPTIGVTDTEHILADVTDRNSANTRIFCLGLGNDLNAVFLDQVAQRTRAVSCYVRPEQDIEARVAGFFLKIQHPVLANLRLSTRGDVQLAEIYPPQLPDLFHGDQLVVLARYAGSGRAELLLSGTLGPHDKQFIYPVDFQTHATGKPFVEQLWARRKVGYLLDQIRINGEQQELVDTVVQIAEQYGITTPYTSYLIMPDVPVELAAADAASPAARLERRAAAGPHVAPLAANGYAIGSFGEAAMKGGAAGRNVPPQRTLTEFAESLSEGERLLGRARGMYYDQAFDRLAATAPRSQATPAGQGGIKEQMSLKRLDQARQLKSTLDTAQANYRVGRLRANQVDKLGVDLAVCTNDLKCQSQLAATAVRRVAERQCLEIGGVWIDQGLSAATRTVAVKAQSNAYFRILERHPQMRDVFSLGNQLVWISPSGTGLVIDTADGAEDLTDPQIDRLFARE